MPTPELSLIVTCKGRLRHLKETLPAMAAQPGAETIVVDVDCPEGTAEWVGRALPQVRVVRLENEPLFNIARARNHGAAAARADRFAFVDADSLLHAGFAEAAVAAVGPGTYAQCVHGRKQLMGCVVVPRSAFEAVQGYDPVFQGWGGEDRDFYRRVERLGLRRVELAPHLLGCIHHGEELRTQFHRIQDRHDAWQINRLYFEVKHGLLALVGEDAPLEVRQRMYAEVEAEFFAARAAGRPPSCSVSLGWQPLVPHMEFERVLTLRVRRAGAPR